MLAQQTLQGYLSYYDSPINNGEQYEGKGKKVSFVKEHINGIISCLVKGRYFNFPVHAYNEVAHFIKQNFPMEYDKSNFPTRRYQVNVACHYSWAKSKKKQAYLLFGVIDYIYPVTNSLVDIVNLTGVDKTTEESNDYSNLEEIDLGKSDEDWEV